MHFQCTVSISIGIAEVESNEHPATGSCGWLKTAESNIILWRVCQSTTLSPLAKDVSCQNLSPFFILLIEILIGNFVIFYSRVFLHCCKNANKACSVHAYEHKKNFDLYINKQNLFLALITTRQDFRQGRWLQSQITVDMYLIVLQFLIICDKSLHYSELSLLLYND